MGFLWVFLLDENLKKKPDWSVPFAQRYVTALVRIYMKACEGRKRREDATLLTRSSLLII